MKSTPLLLSLPLLALSLASCNDNDNDGFGPPTLTAADMSGVTPCPNQTVLTDGGQFSVFKTALLNGTYLYLDVPFNGSDPNIYVKKCGLDANWNPADNTDEVAPASTPVTIADLFVSGNAGICADGFDNGSFGTGEGFPVAGTYRKEIKVSHMGATYHVRFRISVTGSAAGEKFSDRGITVPTDLQSTLGYQVDGVDQVHADVLTAIAGAMTSPSARAMLDVFDMPGGTLLLSALIEIICVDVM